MRCPFCLQLTEPWVHVCKALKSGADPTDPEVRAEFLAKHVRSLVVLMEVVVRLSKEPS